VCVNCSAAKSAKGAASVRRAGRRSQPKLPLVASIPLPPNNDNNNNNNGSRICQASLQMGDSSGKVYTIEVKAMMIDES
jgi:hypothetical protein